MVPRILSTAWFVVFASLTASSYAAEPEFKAGLVAESRTYEREVLGTGVGACTSSNRGLACQSVPQPFRVAVQRVTVALEGERITGESSNSAVPAGDWLAEDFPVGAQVQVAIRGNELRLIHPAPLCAHSRLSAAPCRKWSIVWVRARIVDRVNSEQD